jgi:hypothetical protein
MPRYHSPSWKNSSTHHEEHTHDVTCPFVSPFEVELDLNSVIFKPFLMSASPSLSTASHIDDINHSAQADMCLSEQSLRQQQEEISSIDIQSLHVGQENSTPITINDMDISTASESPPTDLSTDVSPQGTSQETPPSTTDSPKYSVPPLTCNVCDENFERPCDLTYVFKTISTLLQLQALTVTHQETLAL